MARKVEVFVSGCPLCDEAVELVKSLACESCEVILYDLSAGCESCQKKAEEYGVKRVPSVFIDGRLATCCEGGIDARTLKEAGLGQPA